MAICKTCDYAGRPPYKSPCSECDKTLGSPFCQFEQTLKMTNGDRIRAMSNEELADMIRLSQFCPEGLMQDCLSTDSCRDCWVIWLQRPVEDE